MSTEAKVLHAMQMCYLFVALRVLLNESNCLLEISKTRLVMVICGGFHSMVSTIFNTLLGKDTGPFSRFTSWQIKVLHAQVAVFFGGASVLVTQIDDASNALDIQSLHMAKRGERCNANQRRICTP